MEDRRITKREIAEILGLSETSVLRIIHDNLAMSKVYSRWVPHNLDGEKMQNRVDLCKAWKSQLESAGPAFLDRIVTMDEVWVHLYEPETMRQSSQWKHADSPPPQKF